MPSSLSRSIYTPANTITCSNTTTTNGFPLAIVYASEDSTSTNVVSSVVPTRSIIVLNSEITALLLVPENAGIMLISRLTGRNIALMINKICDRSILPASIIANADTIRLKIRKNTDRPNRLVTSVTVRLPLS